MVYPNARVHVPAPEHAFCTAEARIAAAPAQRQGAFGTVKRALTGLTSDQLVKFEPGSTLAPSVQSVAAFGHTPDHTLFTARSEGQSFAYVSDITKVPS